MRKIFSLEIHLLKRIRYTPRDIHLLVHFQLDLFQSTTLPYTKESAISLHCESVDMATEPGSCQGIGHFYQCMDFKRLSWLTRYVLVFSLA